jgi:hypothetical protein
MEASGVRSSTRLRSAEQRREADLRAERRASGAKMTVANLALRGGMERSDKKKKTR